MNKKQIISDSSEAIFKLKFLANEKESIRRKLLITAEALRFKAKQLANTAKEKENIRRKLEVTAKQLAVIAKEKEDTRKKLVVAAKQLADTAKEKESIRRKMANTAEKLRLKAEDFAKITARKKAILASIGDAVMACDENGTVTLFNRKAVAMTGFFAREVIGKHYSQIVRFVKEADNEPSIDFIAEAMKTGHRTIMADNTLLVKKDGHKIPVADSAEPIRYAHGMLIGCVIVFRDISQEKETDRAKSEFISVASHQLKTPGTIVNLYTEKLLDGRNSELSPKQKEYINEIRSANQSMTDIVSSLLNVSRIEMGIFAVDPVPVDVIEIFKNIAKDSDSNLKDKNINFKQEYHQQEHIIPIDKLLLNIIFSNLLSNAIRYTDKNGTISVKSIIKENNLVISVADNGCGIPAGQQNRIFTKFFRADDARSKYTNGTGLGLYIVKSILDHIGGNVWFTSTENKGSTFYFTIPLVRVTIIK